MIEFTCYGSLWTVRGVDEEGRAWLRGIAPEDAQWWAGDLVVEPRYVEGVAAAAKEAGLSYRPSNPS
jgi:hypothetical protein